MMIKNLEIKNHLFRFLILKIIIIGIKIVISTSKIKKIIVIRKKWIEKLIRGLERGSNPHSKGEIFSNSLGDFLFRIRVKKIIILEITIRILNIVNIREIIYINLINLFNWKLNILCILYKLCSSSVYN